MKQHYNIVLKNTEEAIKWILKYQNFDAGSEDYGAYIDPLERHIEAAKWGNGICVNMLVSVYYNEDSVYYKHEEILDRATAAAAHMLKHQNEDGTIDQKSSNYNCTPGAAFTVETIVPIYKILLKNSSLSKEENKLQRILYTFMEKVGFALLNGGFHTPNHRWAIAAVLSELYLLMKKNEYKQMAERYLLEGIDINQDGGFTEKSVGGYDAIVDYALITIADNLNKPELLDIVEKNLNMILKYLQPDGSIFTGHSNRQDRGVKKFPQVYYAVYLMMNYRRNNPKYVFILEEIAKKYLHLLNGSGPVENILTLYMLEEGLKEYEPEHKEAFDDNFEVWMKESGLVRIRRKNYAITLLQDNPQFIQIHTGTQYFGVRLSASFFARGQFTCPEILKIEGGYRLSFNVQYGYIKPFGEMLKSSKWEDMEHGDWANIRKFNTPGQYPKWEDIDHGKRETCNVQKLGFDIDFIEEIDGLSLNIISSGKEGIIYKLEFIMDAGGILEGDAFAIKTEKASGVLVKQGMCKFMKGLEEINFGPGFATHFKEEMKGTEPKDKDGFTVYFTGETPINKKIELKIKNESLEGWK